MRLITGSHVRVPLGLVLTGGGRGRVDLTVRYGIHETPDGPWLIDTGYGPRVTTGPRSLALRLYARLLGPRLIPEASPTAVLRADYGLAATDLTTIVVTHWHADHVAHLRDFPGARIIACGEGWRTVEAMSRRQALQHGIFRELLPEDVARRLVPIQSFPSIETGTSLGTGFDLTGEGRLVALPMPGHAPGHFGLLDTTMSPPVLYASDVTWTLEALASGRTPNLARFVVCHDRAAGVEQENRVRAFMAEGRVLLCHDRESA